MSSDCFKLLEADWQAIEQLRGFIPQKVFDAHCHLYTAASIPHFAGSEIFCQGISNLEDYLQHMRPFLPDTLEIRANVMPMPDPAMRDASNGMRMSANEHIISQLAKNPAIVGSIYVLMDDTEEKIEEMVSNPGVAGIKCYSYAANTNDYNSCRVGDFLPETAWSVANRLGLPIILHLMKPTALADPDNLEYIQTMAKRYPYANLVLAHCARGFASWTVVDNIEKIAQLENVWFDVSSICESAPMAACIIKTAGKRVMWGSDYPICMHRGRVISLDTGFYWLTNEATADLRKKGFPICSVAAENLLAIRQACNLLSLDQTQIEDIFYNNALRLFCRH